MEIKNIFVKPDKWTNRTSWEMRGLTFPYPWRIGKRRFYPQFQGWQSIVPSSESDCVPLVRGRALTLSGINPETIDGFIGYCDSPTPAQFVNTGFVVETPLRGSFSLLHVSRQGELIVREINLSDQDNSPFSLKIRSGEIMSLCPQSRGPNSSMFLETVHPGWNPNTFSDIPEGSVTFNGVSIPPEFWQIRKSFSK